MTTENEKAWLLLIRSDREDHVYKPIDELPHNDVLPKWIGVDLIGGHGISACYESSCSGILAHFFGHLFT